MVFGMDNEMKNKRFVVLMVIAILVIAGGVLLHRNRLQELEAVAAPGPAPWAVDTAIAKQGRATQGFPSLALVKGESDVAIAPRIGGIILEMAAREGERVDTGMVVARIDTREMQDKLASLEAQLAGAEADAQSKTRDARRATDLLKDKSISESQADQLQAAARSAQEHVTSLQKQIAAESTRMGYAEITAPFTGIISARLADPGDLAAVGNPIYRVVATSGGRIEVRLPAAVLEQVRPGNEVVLEHHAQSVHLAAARIYPSLDERSMGRMEIDVDALPFNIAPGGLISARVITKAIDDALLVPSDSVLASAGDLQAWVFVLGDEDPPKLRRVPVEVKMRAAEGVAIAGDVQAGERVVLAHESVLMQLRDGDSVRVERQRQ